MSEMSPAYESTAVRLFIQLGRMPTRGEIFAELIRERAAERQRQHEVEALEKLFEL